MEKKGTQLPKREPILFFFFVDAIDNVAKERAVEEEDGKTKEKRLWFFSFFLEAIEIERRPKFGPSRQP